MKIIHVISRFNSGGTATWLNQLVIGEVFSNDEIKIIFGTCSEDEKEAVPEEKFEVIKLAMLQKTPNPYRDFVAFFQLARIIRKHRPDIVNTHTFKAGIIGRLACAVPGNGSVTVIHTVHGHLKYGYFNDLVSKIILFLERIMQRFTDGFIVAGHRILKELNEDGLLIDTKSKVILPGLKLDPHNLALRRKSLLNVGWLGRLTQIKRPDRVLEVASLLPQFQFYIAGHGELDSQLRENLPKNVHLVGWVDPEIFWRDMSVGLLTSDNEATPYAIIEGNRCGIPFVATNVGSVTDVVEDGRNGYLAEGNSTDLALKLVRMLSDESELQRLSENALFISMTKFSGDRFQREHRDFYVDILNGSFASPS